MSTTSFTRSRRLFAAGAFLLAIAFAGACDGTSPAGPDGLAGTGTLAAGDSAGTPGDTTGLPGDTTGTPGDTTGLPGDTTGLPGDTTGLPGDTTGVPGDTVPNRPGSPEFGLFVKVGVPADSAVSALVPGVVVEVVRGASGNGPVVARDTTIASGWLRFALKPGEYVVRVASVPEGYVLADFETAEKPVSATPYGLATIGFVLLRR